MNILKYKAIIIPPNDVSPIFRPVKVFPAQHNKLWSTSVKQRWRASVQLIQKERENEKGGRITFVFEEGGDPPLSLCPL